MTKTAINPADPMFNAADGQSIFDKFGYSAAVRAGDFLYVAGQIGPNPDGSLPDEDSGQFRNAFDRLQLVLQEAGAGLNDIVELVTYHVGLHSHLAEFVKVKEGYIRAPYPTWTILEVAGLARPGLVIEIKAVAYTGSR